jgi:hypothetical protein
MMPPPKGCGPCKTCVWNCSYKVCRTNCVQLALTTLFPWLCKFISFWTLACEFVLVPSWSSSMPPLPQKCYKLKNMHFRTIFFSIISLWDPHSSLSRSLRAHHLVLELCSTFNALGCCLIRSVDLPPLLSLLSFAYRSLSGFACCFQHLRSPFCSLPFVINCFPS